MASLETQFKSGVEFIKSAKGDYKPSNAEKLKFYALYKQATEGDVKSSISSRPGAFDIVGRAKWDAHNRLKGKTTEAAMKEYVAALDQVAPNWRATSTPATNGEQKESNKMNEPTTVEMKTEPVSMSAASGQLPQQQQDLVLIETVALSGGSGNFAILRMNRKPVNSFNFKMLQAIEAAIESLERDPTVKGFVLASTHPSIFSAGLDILEMHRPTKERYVRFWDGLRSCFMKLFSTPLVTIAAIQGQCPAAGCLFAMACDYRVMADSESLGIGLNETQLGIVAPKWFMKTMSRIVGERQSDKLLQLGSMVSPQEALRIGLVDEIVPMDRVLSAAAERMGTWTTVHKDARVLTKQILRQDLVEYMTSNRDTEAAWALTSSPQVQKDLEQVLKRLSSRGGGSPRAKL